MTGDFDVDQKSQLCSVVDSTMVKGSDDTASKQAFSFANSFQTNTTKSACRGDVIDDQNIDSGNSFCRQGLGDHLASQNRISSNNLYCNDQPSNSTVSDAIESNIESLKALSLKPDNVTPPFQPLSSGSAKTRDMAFSTVSSDGNPFSFERSQSAQKFDSCSFLGDTANASSSGKSHSTPESSSGIESTYSSTNPRNQLLQESENPPSTGENHLGGCSSSYWNTAGNAQTEELNYLTTALSVNSSPLLTNLLFQQPSNSPVSTNSGSQSNSGTIGSKRPIIGGHQGMRPLSRPPGWNPTTTSFDSNFAASSDQSSFFTPTSTGLASSKAPGWMGHFSPQNSTYPWSSTASQQNAFKANFADPTSGFSSSSSVNGSRFGANNSLSNMGSNGFPKGSASSNPASLYSMFSKRPSHRVTAHWQQQHQQHMQQTPPSILSKQHSSDFSSSGPLSIGGQDSVLNQKMPHGSFGSNSGMSPMASGVVSGNMDSLNADRYSSYGFDQHLIELMKSMDSSGTSQSGLLDDLAFGMPRMDNYHGNLHSLPGMSQSRPGLMSSGLQNQGLHAMGNAHSSLSAMAPREEGYSRKVFVGGLPPDIDEGNISASYKISYFSRR